MVSEALARDHIEVLLFFGPFRKYFHWEKNKRVAATA